MPVYVLETSAAHMGLSVKGEAEVDMVGLVSWKDSIVDRLNKGVEGLLKAAGAELVKGWASFDGPKSCTVESSSGSVKIEAENVIIATGSSHIDLPFMPCDEEFVLSSSGALDLEALPKCVAIVGGSCIGLELGYALAKLGSEITVVEGMSSVLAIMDKEIRRPLELWLKKHKVSVHTDALARGVEIKGRGASKKAELTFEKDGSEHKVKVDKVLVTVGRKPNTRGWGLENTGVRMDTSGRFIRTDRQCRTSVPGVYAIGDVAGEPMLAHKATHEGKVAAEVAAGLPSAFDARSIPSVAYTDPEIAWVGLSETDANSQGIKFEKSIFPWAASGRALGLTRTAGLTKLLFEPGTRRLLGAGIVGVNAGDLIAEACLAIEMQCEAQDIGLTIHPHPTLSETLALAAEAFDGTITDLYLPRKN